MKKIFFIGILIGVALFVVVGKANAFVETRITSDSYVQAMYAPDVYDNKIVWSDNRNGNFDVYMYDLDTSTETQITTDNNFQAYPNIYDDKIVWMDDRNGNNDIYMYDLSTSTETQITTNNSDQQDPVIYADKIVWTDYRNDYGDIYMYDLFTSTETQITTNGSAQWAPDIFEDKIVWTDSRTYGDYNIYMYDLSASTETQITTNNSEQSNATVYDDKIAYQDNRNGNNDIYMYDLSTSTETQITTNSSDQWAPVIFEDKIVWVDQRSGYDNKDIYMYDLSTSAETQITTNNSDQSYPTIYEDKIVWVDDRHDISAGYSDIYMTFLPKPRYWVGNGGNWNDTSHWSTTSGGEGGATIPTIYDAVIFDENSITSADQTITVDVSEVPSLDFTNVLNFPTLYLDTRVDCYGDFILAFGMQHSSAGNGSIDFMGTGGIINTNGVPLHELWFYFAENSDYEVVSDIEVYGIDMGNNYLTFSCDTITLIGAYLYWGNYTAVELDMGTADLVFDTSECDPSDRSYVYFYDYSAEEAYNDVIFKGDNGNDVMPKVDFYFWPDEAGSNIAIDSLEFQVPCYIYIGSSENTLSVNNFVCDGTSEQQAVLFGDSELTLSKADGTVNLTYTTLSNSVVAGGATFNAFLSNGNVDGGGNSGWNFIEYRTLYWIGNGGNWNDIDHWSLESDGSGGEDIPTIYDDVVFDENSITSAGQEILFPSSAIDDILILNFTGEDGATEWEEEAQDLDPASVANSEIDSSSLKVSNSGYLTYYIPTTKANFNLQFKFSFDPVVGSGGVEQFSTGLQESDGDTEIGFGVASVLGNERFGISIVDREGNVISNALIANPFSSGVEYEAEIAVDGRDITLSVDGEELASYTAEIDDPFLGADVWGVQNTLTSDGWVDDVHLTSSNPPAYSGSWDMEDLAYPITMDSENGTDPWTISIASGTVEAYNTTLINSQAVGGATFNALTSNDNFDGGGNTGWNFDCTGVWTAEDLDNVRNDLAGCYIQMADIDMTDYPDFESVGMIDFMEDLEDQEDLMFQGTYDGGGFEITNLNAPLFAIVGENGTVENINIPDAFADGSRVALMLPFSGGLSFDGRGIAIFNFGTISRCEITGRAENTTDNMLVGVGINLVNQGTIEECYANTETLNQAENTSSFAYGGINLVNASSASEFNLNGGEGIIRESFANQKNDIEITEMPDILGMGEGFPIPAAGVTELNYGTVEDCYVIFDIDAVASSMSAFGSVGLNAGNVSKCYVTGEFTGEGVGIIVSALSLSEEQLVFDSYYSSETGASTPLDYFAILEGYTDWEDCKTHLTPEQIEYYEELFILMTGEQKTDSELKTQSTFENWDFDNIWYIDERNDYPVLRWALSDDNNEEDSGSKSIHINEITDITKDSVKLKVEVNEDYAEQNLDFTVKIRNEDEDETDEDHFTKETDEDGKVSLTIDDLESNTNYKFSVKFSPHNDDDYSDYSSSKDAKTDSDIEGEECVPVLSSKAVSTSRINLFWKDSCDREDGYYLERKMEGSNFRRIAKLKENAKSYEDENLNEDTKYIYRIQTYRQEKTSDYSNESSATTLKNETEEEIPATTEPEEESTPPAETTVPSEEPTINPNPTPKNNIKTSLNNLANDQNLQTVTAALATVGLITGAAAATAATSIPLFPIYPSPLTESLFSRFFSVFGILGRSKKRKNDVGFVFDEETRRPIAGASVSIINEEGRMVDTAITDQEGRYGFLATDGIYTIQVSKKGYELSTNESQDEFYGNLYAGKPIEIKRNEMIKTSLAMKAQNVDWKDFAERKLAAYTSIFSVVKKDAFLVLFYVGFFASLATMYFYPTILNGCIIALYIVIGVYNIFFKVKSFGIISNQTNKPMPFSMISLYDQAEPTKRIAFTVSDVLGRYYLLVKDGLYDMKIQGQELGGNPFTKTIQVYAEKGVIKEDVVVG